MHKAKNIYICLLLVIAAALLLASCATGQQQTGAFTQEDVVVFDKSCKSFEYDHINFATDKYEIKDFHKPALDYWKKYLAECPYVYLEIQGHCDERASYEYNMDLGARRAFSVQNYLLKAGVEKERLSVVTFGEHMPVKEGHTRADWKVNRRVKVVPKIMPQ